MTAVHGAGARPAPPPDSPPLLVVGDIITLDPARPRAQALAVADGRVAAVGDLAEVRDHVPAGAAQLPVAGTAVPGFVDSHVHLMWVGRQATRVALAGVTSIRELQDRIRHYAARHPDQEWIEGDAGFEPAELAERRLPTAEELEHACPGRPVLLDRKGHDALANRTALQRAGITAATPDPAGGRIDRDGSGAPTGLLVEHPAVALVQAAVPAPDAATRVAWIAAGQAELLGHGICTAVDPAVSIPELAAYVSAWQDSALRLRTVVMPWGDDQLRDADLDRAVRECGLDRADPAWLGRGPTKLFLDGGGSLGTALRSRPWPDSGGYHGQQSLPVDALRAHCAAAAKAGRGVGVHAVGDAAVDLVLDVLTEVDRHTPVAGLGFHLIHAYLEPSAAAMATARRLGVAVSAHPALQWQVGAALADRLGETVAAAANPVRRWLDAGVLVGGGSDGPGPPVSVLRGMWQARTRAVRGRPEPLGPAQAVTGYEALAMFTTGAARVAGCPDRGILRPGAPADLAILDVDPLHPDPAALAEGRVVATVVAGTLVTSTVHTDQSVGK